MHEHLDRPAIDDKDAHASLSSTVERQGCLDALTPLLRVFGLQRYRTSSNNHQEPSGTSEYHRRMALGVDLESVVIH